jgi:tryptophan 7-halogenase
MNGNVMSGNQVKSILVLGDPLQGWVAATMLSVMLRPLAPRITLLTSSSYAPGGHQQRALVSSNCFLNQANLLALLGVSLPEFVQRCQASFRLGDSYRAAEGGIDFMQTFCGSNFAQGTLGLPEILARINASGGADQVSDYTFSAQMAQAKKFHGLDNGEFSKTDLANIGVNFLRAEFVALFEARRARLAIEHINLDQRSAAELANLQVERAADGGICGLQLGADYFAADLFIDCSGARRQMIGPLSPIKPLGRVWVEHLDRNECPAQFSPDLPATQYWIAPKSLTKAVFFADRVQLESFYTSANAVPSCAHLQHFYRAEQSWVHNCIALGQAAADIGDFAINELDLVQQTIPLLVEHFPRLEAMPALARQFNTMVNEQLDYYWDFHWLLLNSAELQRESAGQTALLETPFSANLQQRLASYRSSARLSIGDYEALSENYWTSFLLGLGCTPQRVSPACDTLDMAQIKAALAAEKTVQQQRLVGLKPYREVLQALRQWLGVA